MNAYFPLSDIETPTVCASCVIFWDSHNRVALQLRDSFANVPAPGQWGAFGGEIEQGETPINAAIREVKEELGIALLPTDLTPHAIAASPRGVRLYSHLCARRIEPHEITLGEGAGFAFLTQTQIGTLPVLPAIKTLLHHFFENHPHIG